MSLSPFRRAEAAISRLVRRVALQLETLENRFPLDSSGPMSVVVRAPDANQQVAVEFDRPVIGVDITDFTLQRGAVSIDLSTAVLQSTSAQEYWLTVPNLEDGDYLLQLIAESSGIVDEANSENSLSENAQVGWTRDTLAPTLTAQWTLPQPTEQPVLRIAALGDSQTAKQPNSYVGSLRQHLSSDRYSINVFAVGGYTVNEVRNLWNSQVKDAGYDLAVIFAGVNDLARSDQTAQSIFAGLQTMFGEAHARGMQVVAVGVPPWSHHAASTAIKRSTTVELNALIEQYVADHSANMRFIDAYAELSSEQEPHRLATRYDWGDGLHLAAAGDRRLATLVAEAVESLRQPVEQAAAVDLLFSEPVTEWVASDFQLTLDGQPALFQLSPISPTTLRLEFALPSGQQNQVSLSLSPATTVSDLSGNLLTDSTTWSVIRDQLAPSASLSLDVPAVSADTVTEITIDFSAPITGFDIGDIQLIGPNGNMDLQSAVLTALDADSYALALGSLAEAPGGYRLILTAGSSQIKDLNTNPLERSALVDWVRLPSAVTTNAGLVTFPGTPSGETIELNIHAETIEYWIDGLLMEYSLQDVERVTLTPLDGEDIVAIQWMRESSSNDGEPVNAPLVIEAFSNDVVDTISLFGTSGNDDVSAAPLNVKLSNAWFTASAVGFSRVNASAAPTIDDAGTDAGIDSIVFSDSASAERFIGRSDRSTHSSDSFANHAYQFETVVAHSSGGSDSADMYDSPRDDTYVGRPTSASLTGPGYSLLANNFPVVNAHSLLGRDTAALFGSVANDTFAAYPDVSILIGPDYRHRVVKFEQVQATGNGGSGAGGSGDEARMYDSAGIDHVTLSPRVGQVQGNDFNNRVDSFDRINVYSRFDNDSLVINGSSGVDTFHGQQGQSSLLGNGYSLSAFRFRNVTTNGMGGSDIARLYDSPGNDQLTATHHSATLLTPTYQLTAVNFPLLYAYARSGNDVASLTGTESNETYTGYATHGLLSGGGRNLYAYGFDAVTAHSGGGNDLAALYDSPGDDRLVSSPTQAQFSGQGFVHTAIGYRRTNVFGRLGHDTASLTGSPEVDRFIGAPGTSYLTGSINVNSTSVPFANYAYGFDVVTANGGGGGDTAVLNDSIGNDTLTATPKSTTLAGPGFRYVVNDFLRVNAFARSGTDTALMTGSIATETFVGQTNVSYMLGPGYGNYAYTFDVVIAEAGGGADIANLYDSPANDVFTAAPSTATLSGPAYSYTANGYARVNAYARTGLDTANLIGSTQTDSIVGRSDSTSVRGSNFLLFASGFDAVSVAGGGGNDLATLNDSIGDDRLTIAPRTATLVASTYRISLESIFRLNIVATQGNDQLLIIDSPGNEHYYSRGQSGRLTYQSFTANFGGFDRVILSPSVGGRNKLDVAVLTYSLEVGLGWE